MDMKRADNDKREFLTMIIQLIVIVFIFFELQQCNIQFLSNNIFSVLIKTVFTQRYK